MAGALSALPSELIHNIAFFAVAHTPLGPPAVLLDLLLTCKALYAQLSAPSFLARVFRLKFDAGAVTRRLFRPYHQDLAEQLVLACHLLRALRSGNIYDVETETHLGTAFLMMLDNDGKNYAQLAAAGVHAYVEAYVQRRLWEGRERNEGWPLDSEPNACALWLLWLTSERGRLLQEPIDRREDLVLRILPFVVSPHRYAASEAPPNHFDLPLDPTRRAHQPPIAFRLPNSHRTYPHYLPPRGSSQPYFRARPYLTRPLSSIAAKLLFVARRELRSMVIPSHIPAGPGQPQGPLTQADYHELNRRKAAELPRGARWDWDRGVAVIVNANPDAPVGMGMGTSDVIEDEDEESRKWDTTFWRMRLCGDYRAPRPKFAPGEVFKLGSMSGPWQGKIYIPAGAQFTQLLHNPHYPGVADERAAQAGIELFSEAALGLVMQPVFLEVEEHHRVCMCGREEVNAKGGGGEVEEGLNDPRGCGIIPIPQPARRLWVQQGVGVHPVGVPAAGAPPPAAAAAPLPHPPHPPATVAPAPAPVVPHPQQPSQTAPAPQNAPPHPHPPQTTTAPTTTAITNGPPTIHSAPDGNANPTHLQLEAAALTDIHARAHARTGASSGMGLPDRVDLGMCNAWFPGAQGGVGWVRREGRGGGGSKAGGIGVTMGEGEERRRDEVVFGVGYVGVDRRAGGGCVSVSVAAGGEGVKREGEGERERERSYSSAGSASGSDTDTDDGTPSLSASPSTGRQNDTPTASNDKEREKGKGKDKTRRNAYVYETYDPARLSSHDVFHSGFSSSSSSSNSKSSKSSNSKSTPNPHPHPNPNPHCASCATRERAVSAQRKREEEEARRVLDGVMRDFEMGGSLSSGSSLGPSSAAAGQGQRKTRMRIPRRFTRGDVDMVVDDEDEDMDEEMEMRDLDMSGFGEAVGRVLGDAAASAAGFTSSSSTPSAPEDSDSDLDLDLDLDLEDEVEVYDDDEEEAYDYPDEEDEYMEEGEEEDDAYEYERIEVLGDDLPRGEPAFWSSRTSSSSRRHSGLMTNAYAQQPLNQNQTQTLNQNQKRQRVLIPATRREYDRARIGVACKGVRDVVITGETPSSSSRGRTGLGHGAAGAGGQGAGGQGGQGIGVARLWQAYTCYGRVRMWDGLVGILRITRTPQINYIFIFGYVVGETNFVGEWRVAASDPLRPVWGSAFVMSRRGEDGVPVEASAATSGGVPPGATATA
ncbi:hypothetical protein GALMADRAFT_218961 [Galerina marginata CBS 339.88]|uniref:F-box domain-containing protein n=1 Tax=Galerina marginata (strain CBS 339.88) TaxID=685588 RepID=A0A067U3B0_GALM3|nr:hypothetical protein GALMADRAFT_218961 [Galerina marginata CBS 339.88]